MSELGSTKMSMRQLARECGLNVAAIYYYFESKDALLTAVIDERRYGARLAVIPQIDPSLPPQDRLAIVFATVWDGALAEEPVWRLLLGEGLRGEPAALPVGRGLLEVFRPGLADWLDSAIPEVQSPDAVTDLLIGQLFAGFVRHIFDPDTPLTTIRDEAGRSLAKSVAFRD